MLRFLRISIVEPWISRDWSFLRRQESGLMNSHLRGIKQRKSRGNLEVIASSFQIFMPFLYNQESRYSERAYSINLDPLPTRGDDLYGVEIC